MHFGSAFFYAKRAPACAGALAYWGRSGIVAGTGEGPILDVDILAQVDIGQSGTAVEGTLADVVHVLQVDGGQSSTVLEGVVADLGDVLAQDHGGQILQLVESHLTDDGTLTFVPSDQNLDGQVNLKNYWKVNGVLTLPWGEYAEMITKVVIADGIHDIGQMAFYELPNLTEVVLGKDVTEIRNYAFKNCASLVSINLELVDDIREGAFYGCSALKDITLGASVNIEDWAFSKTAVVLP